MINDVTSGRQFAHYQKKIISYLDGSLSAEERSEFEAYVRTHPEIEEQIKSKQEELLLLKSFIPAVQASKQTIESLEVEIKSSIDHLLNDGPRNVWDRLKVSIKDWVNH